MATSVRVATGGLSTCRFFGGPEGPPLRLNSRAFRVLQRQLQLPRQRVDRGSLPLPRAFALEPKIADATAPWRDHPSNGTEVGAIGVLLIEPPNHVWRHPDERPQRGGRLDAVLAAIP